MTDSINTSTSNPYAAYGLTGSSTSGGTQLGQDDFLSLMTAQVQNQNPLEPTDNAEFFSQIAQFSTVSGIGDLNNTMNGLAMSMSSTIPLQAAGLVGHDVLIKSDEGVLDADGMQAAAEVPASGPVTVQIHDDSGALVRTISLGDQSAGMVNFTWDGLSSSGERMPPGNYSISASVGGETPSDAVTYAQAAINSVSLANGIITLQVEGLGSTTFDQVREIL